MPVLSYVHQLFNADNCHVYSHTLRCGGKIAHSSVPGARARRGKVVKYLDHCDLLQTARN